MNADLVMALALIHHIAISNNVPLNSIAEWFSKLARYLIIEFVPKEDSQVELLLRTRVDIFNSYTQENFEEEFIVDIGGYEGTTSVVIEEGGKYVDADTFSTTYTLG